MILIRSCYVSSHSKVNKGFTSANLKVVSQGTIYFMETLNSIQTLNYIKLRSSNTRKITSKQVKNNQY